MKRESKIVIGFACFAIADIVAVGLYMQRQLKAFFAEQQKEAESMDYANRKIRMKIFEGGYNGMTTEEIEEAVKNDFEIFRMEARIVEVN